MDDAALQIRRQALEDAIAIAETSWTAHDNSTGHHKGAWIDARKDIVTKLREQINKEQPHLVREYGMPALPSPRPKHAE